VKGAKGIWRAIRGGDEAVAVVKSLEETVMGGRTLDVGLSRRTGDGHSLLDTQGRVFSPDDDIIVYHTTSKERALAFQEGGIQPGGKPVDRPITIVETEDVAEMLGKEVGDALDYEPGRGLGEGLYVHSRGVDNHMGWYGDTVVGIRVKVGDLKLGEEYRGVLGLHGTPEMALLIDNGYITKSVAPDDIVSIATYGEGLWTVRGSAGGVARETGYRGMHTSPERLFSEGGDTLDDLSGIYPDDVYGPDAPRLYGSHGSEYSKPNRTMKEVLHSVRGNPDAEVEVFRAVPEGVTEINPGDWVSPSRDYAVIHGEGPMRGDYQIISRKVRAGDLFTEANSLYEFGWDPS